MELKNIFLAILLCLATHQSGALAQTPSFTVLETLEGTPGASAFAVSGDGRVISGDTRSSILNDGSGFSVIWEDGKVRDMRHPSHTGKSGGNIFAMSEDGSIIYGTDPKFGRYRWTVQGFEDSPVADSMSVNDISADGSVHAGSWKTGHAAIFKDGMKTIVSELAGSQLHAISADGKRALGSSYIEPTTFIWDEQSGVSIIDPGATFKRLFPSTLSSDGNVMTGSVTTATKRLPMRWTAAAGIEALEGVFTGVDSSIRLYSISGNGELIGGDGYRKDYEAIVWTRATGIVHLQKFLESTHGVNFQGWKLQTAAGISSDGRTIVGTAKHETTLKSAGYRIANFPAPKSDVERQEENVTIRVFPNPARRDAAVEIQFDQRSATKLTIVDAIGREVEASYEPIGNGVIRVDLRGYVGGTYYAFVPGARMAVPFVVE